MLRSTRSLPTYRMCSDLVENSLDALIFFFFLCRRLRPVKFLNSAFDIVGEALLDCASIGKTTEFASAACSAVVWLSDVSIGESLR